MYIKNKVSEHKFIVLLFMSIIFVGCTSKMQSNINSYITQHKNINKNINSTKVNFKMATDIRDTNIVSTIYYKDKKKKEFDIDVDLKNWYQNAMIRELKSAKMYDENSGIDISINIKSIEAQYEKYSIEKDNLKVDLSIEVVIKQEKTTSKINITLNQSRYKPMILDAQGFDNILNDILKSSIERSVNLVLLKLTDKKGL